jgi:hypothetical protein
LSKLQNKEVGKQMIEQVERLIKCINDVHLQYSNDYFEAGQVDKINLTKSDVPLEHILRYRLNLHESINDYLLEQDLSGIVYYYRVKTSESIIDKVKRFTNRAESYPVNKWMNDIFGARMILSSTDMDKINELLDDWTNSYGLKNWYLKDTSEYKGLHIYFKNKSNYYFPWELQLWNENDVKSNITNHRLYKRGFVN